MDAKEIILLLTASLVMWAGGCFMYEQRDYNLHVWATEISDGRGNRCPPGSRKDCYTLCLEGLDCGNESFRVATANFLGLTSVWAGDRYDFLLDAYIDGGRREELLTALRAAWKRSEQGSRERCGMSLRYVDARIRAYLWDHPSLATEVGLSSLRPPLRGWYPWREETQERLAARMIQEGDREFEEAWRDFTDHLARLRAGTLKPYRTPGLNPSPERKAPSALDEIIARFLEEETTTRPGSPSGR